MMTRRPTVLTLILSLLAAGPAMAADLPAAKPEQVGLSPERLERIGLALRADVERGRIPGAVVVVARKGRIAYMQAVGFRDKPAGTPMAGSAGDYFWPGAYATYWWADPKEEMVVVSMMQSPLGRHYQQLVRALVLQAIAK
jgi:CubicO group peptidase (beta-lactamase class C family)